MSASHRTKVLIIGAGPAGYTASIYAARANLKPIQALGLQPGGQLMITTDVENYPGFKDIIQGPWLMEQMQAQAEHVGVDLVDDTIVEVDFSKRPFTCKGEMGDVYVADTVIIATGAQAKWLGLAAEEEFMGFGVSGCATCDGVFFKDKEVAVVGGGDTAVEEALFLTHHASKITLIHRRDALRAEKVMQDRLFKHPKIEVIWDHVVEEILGDDNPKAVTSLRLRNVKTDATKNLDTQGVFIAIGHKPATEVFGGQIDLDKDGYIVCHPAGSTQTNVAGVFAAGDVQDKVYRQAVTAAGQGCMAALDVDKFLASEE